MPRDYDPLPDDDDTRKRHKAPKALRKLWRLFPYESQLYTFRQVFSRDPASDDELELFAENYIIEAYNNDRDDPRLPGDPTANEPD